MNTGVHPAFNSVGYMSSGEIAGPHTDLRHCPELVLKSHSGCSVKRGHTAGKNEHQEPVNRLPWLP